MLIKHLLQHQYKSFLRNERWRRNLLSKIIYSVMIANAIIAFFIVGRSIDQLLNKAGGNPVDTFNTVLLWYIAVDLLLRCLLQPLPTLQVTPYLRFRINRSKIIWFLLFRSWWNIFSLIPWLVFVPFSIKIILEVDGALPAITYLFGILLIIVLNNYVAVFIGFLTKKNFFYLLIPAAIVLVLPALEKLGYPVNNLSIDIGNKLIQANLAVFALLAVLIVVVVIFTRRLLLANFYIDEISTDNTRRYSFNMPVQHSFGRSSNIGRRLWFEINLLLRNKRPRQMLGMLPVFLAYFLFIVINNHTISSLFFLIIISMVTGFGPALYGQFIFSWESAFFDGIMARKNNFVEYVRAKYYLMAIMAIITFVPFCIALAITGKADVFLFSSMLLFTLGVICFIILLFATLNDGRIELGQGSFFNYQGVKGNQFILSFVFILLPLGLYKLFSYLVNDTAGKLSIAIPGLLFMLFHNWWIKKIIVPRFYARKYKNLEGYRKLSV